MSHPLTVSDTGPTGPSADPKLRAPGRVGKVRRWLAVILQRMLTYSEFHIIIVNWTQLHENLFKIVVYRAESDNYIGSVAIANQSSAYSSSICYIYSCSRPQISDSPSPHHQIVITSAPMFVGCLTSQQHASVSQGRICSDKFTCCHTEIVVVDQNFHHPVTIYRHRANQSQH